VVELCLAGDATGYTVSETNLDITAFDVTAKCAEGYEGTAAVEACKANKEKYVLSGCSLIQLCLAPETMKGYVISETNLKISNFGVTAQCAAGYVGTAIVQSCTSNGESYKVSGCEFDPVCLAPADKAGYSVTESVLASSKFDVTATCAAGYEGTPVVTVCGSDGKPYSLSGCKVEQVCVAPVSASGYAVTETVMVKSKFDVTAKCAAGYTGTAIVTACASDGGTYTLGGCEKEQLCTAPSSATGYTVTETVLAKNTFDVTAKCAAGYTGTAIVTACASDGGTYTLEGCELDVVCVAPKTSRGYMISETSLLKASFDVTAVCASGYSGTASVEPCAESGFPYVVSGCSQR